MKIEKNNAKKWMLGAVASLICVMGGASFGNAAPRFQAPQKTSHTKLHVVLGKAAARNAAQTASSENESASFEGDLRAPADGEFPPSFEGPTSHEGPLSPEDWVPRLQQWCNDVSEILSEGQGAAQGQLQQEDYAGAVDTLFAALREASESIDFGAGAQQPFTRKLIDRGIYVSQAIAGLVGSDEFGQLTLAKFMFDYVGFAIEAANELDSGYYIPFYYGCGGRRDRCGGDFDFMSFERKYVEFGQKQLDFVTQHLTVDRGGWLFPSGKPAAFLKAAQLFSSYVAQDLSKLPDIAYTQACTVVGLSRFSWKAGRVLANPTHPYPFPTLPVAVNALAHELEYRSQQLGAESCFRR